MNASAIFETRCASRYLTSLCNHFGRKVEADCTPNTGWVQFQFGRCEMSADESALEVTALADDEKRLDQVVQIVTSHLERFAFRENPILAWRPSET